MLAARIGVEGVVIDLRDGENGLCPGFSDDHCPATPIYPTLPILGRSRPCWRGREPGRVSLSWPATADFPLDRPAQRTSSGAAAVVAGTPHPARNHTAPVLRRPCPAGPCLPRKARSRPTHPRGRPLERINMANSFPVEPALRH